MLSQATSSLTLAAWIFGGIVAVALSAFFSGMETGVYVVNKMRLELRAEKPSSARLLKKMFANWNNVLATLLIGTNISAYIVTFSISVVISSIGFDSHKTEMLTMLFATMIIFVFGDSVPKSIFRRFAETLVYRFAWLLKVFSVLFNVCGLAIIVRAAAAIPAMLASRKKGKSHLGHEGVKAILDEGHASGAMTHSQLIMADRTIRIPRLTLADVMCPMKKCISAPINISREDAINLISRQTHARIPLAEKDGRIAKVLYIYDLLLDEDDASPAQKAKDTIALPSNMKIIDALYRMQTERVALAVVEGKSGRNVGIVTPKDLVEEIVGELDVW